MPERDYPRCLVVLQVDLEGSTTPLDVTLIPRTAKVARRSHQSADTAEVVLDGTSVPFDPRAIRSILATVHMGQARTMHDVDWRAEGTVGGGNTRRFVGYLDEFAGEQNDDDDTITLTARDLSAPLRDTKPLPTAGVPLYSDTLGQAVDRILRNVPGGEAMRVCAPPLVAQYGDFSVESGVLDVALSRVVHERVGRGPIHLGNDMSAWAVIEYVAGLCGRTVAVELDNLVFRAPESSYDNNAAPRVALSFGVETANLMSLKPNKKFIVNRKGVRVVGWNPIARTEVHADWPPDGELPSRGRPAANRHARGAGPRNPERDIYLENGIHTEDGCKDIARSIWLERSRQEMSVEAVTPFFTDAYLGLRSGHRVRIQLNRALASGLNVQQPRAAQVEFVSRRLGVSNPTAELLVDTALRPGSDLFYTRGATLRWSADGDVGVDMDLINLFAVDAPEGQAAETGVF